MTDAYTKAVLTVIAVALSVIAIRSAVPSALALGDGCGSSYSAPCYVTTTTKEPIYVTTPLGLPIEVTGTVRTN